MIDVVGDDVSLFRKSITAVLLHSRKAFPGLFLAMTRLGGLRMERGGCWLDYGLLGGFLKLSLQAVVFRGIVEAPGVKVG